MTRGFYREVARRLTPPQRDLLLKHLDATDWVLAPVLACDRGHVLTMRSLVKLRLIEFDGYGGRPRFTRLTEAGRMTVALALAALAETLTRAGLTVERGGEDAIVAHYLRRAAGAKPRRSVLAGEHDRDDGLAVVSGSAQGLQRDEPVGVAPEA